MTVFEITSIIGLFVGPVVAASWTIWAQERQRRLISKQSSVAQFLTVHDDPVDPTFSILVRRIPLEFSDRKMVLVAWNDWMRNLAITPNYENQPSHFSERDRLKMILLRELTNNVGWHFHESDIQRLIYRSQGFIDRQSYMAHIQSESVASIKRIAEALERQAPPLNSETV